MLGSKNLRRRDFLRLTGALTTGLAVTSTKPLRVHASEANAIRVGIVGCGGRGRGSARQALCSPIPTKLIALGDAFENSVKFTLEFFESDEIVKSQVDVGENTFFGLDSYKKVMDVLSPGDVVILATPAAFRPLYYEYAVRRGLHVFMEKPLAVDSPGCRRMIEANKIAKEKNLKVVVGLNNRHYWPTEETIKKIQDGGLGDIISCWVYRLQNEFPFIHDPNLTPFQNQLRGFQNWTWGGGSYMVDWMIHNIDICCWARGEKWPVSVQGQGGRQVRKANDQMYDHCAYEYTFDDGVKMMVQLRQIPKTWDTFKSVIHGTKGCAVVGEGVVDPRIYKGLKEIPENIVWKPESPSCDPYQEEIDRLLRAICDDKTWNEVDRGTEATFTAIMGRMAVDSGKELFRDPCWNSTYELTPGIENWTMESEAPVKPDENGIYPLAIPGETVQY